MIIRAERRDSIQVLKPTWTNITFDYFVAPNISPDTWDGTTYTVSVNGGWYLVSGNFWVSAVDSFLEISLRSTGSLPTSPMDSAVVKWAGETFCGAGSPPSTTNGFSVLVPFPSSGKLVLKSRYTGGGPANLAGATFCIQRIRDFSSFSSSIASRVYPGGMKGGGI